MATIYSPNSNKSLAEFLENIIRDCDSNIVIPDLQRPYVWTPLQVILLIDSIFKKWPFGSLLCWEVKKNENNDYIPFRPFWRQFVSDEVANKESEKTSISKDAKSYLMILDGQQRIQSLVLALGGDSWGFTLSDKEWKKYLEGVETNINSKYWTSGCLCLDIKKFDKEYKDSYNKIADVDVKKFLVWATTDENTGLSDKNKKNVLPIVKSNNNDYIRFSKIWKLANSNLRIPSDYEKVLLEKYPDLQQDTIKRLSEFMLNVSDVKENTNITQLTIKNFENSGISDKSNYNNAIVNIFARLNAAGRVLTPQEITLAWLKTGWREAANINANPIDCQEELKLLLESLRDRYGNSTMKITMDNIVDILSLFWIIIEKDGNDRTELILKNKDLLDGNIIKKIGEYSFGNWEIIKDSILICQEEFENSKLGECFDRSFYAFYIICGWQFICQKVSKNLDGRIRETECKFDVQINQIFSKFIDRWFFSTMLSQTWSVSENYPMYISILCKLYNSVKKITDPNTIIDLLKTGLDNILTGLKDSTINRINEMNAYKRNEVIGYKNILWLWNRLDMSRYDVTKKPMKRLTAAPRIEVDHAIPVEIWKNKVEEEYPVATSNDSSGKEKEFQIGEKRFTRSSLMSFINVIGNCSLLLRSHNRSKQDEEFGNFLKDVYSTEQIKEFKLALFFDDIYLFPSKYGIESIIKQLEERSKKIKNDLINYISDFENKRYDIT